MLSQTVSQKYQQGNDIRRSRANDVNSTVSSTKVVIASFVGKKAMMANVGGTKIILKSFVHLTISKSNDD